MGKEMKEIITRGDKISLFFFKYLFPTFYEELLWLNREYRKAQEEKRIKQSKPQAAERKIRQLERRDK